MFKTMGRIQNLVLIVAGVATAGLFGISITDIKVAPAPVRLNSASLSADERLKISRKLKIGSTLNNRNIPGDQFRSRHGRLRQQPERSCKAAGLAVSDHELGDYLHKSFSGKDQYNNFVGVMQARYGLKVNELEDLLSRPAALLQNRSPHHARHLRHHLNSKRVPPSQRQPDLRSPRHRHRLHEIGKRTQRRPNSKPTSKRTAPTPPSKCPSASPSPT